MEPVCCPRCGYDQRGAMAAWESAAADGGERATCPVRGVCSECGLEFAWGSLLNPALSVSSWMFEHVRGWWRVPRASWRNGWASLRGGGTGWWRRVRMEHQVRPLRLIAHWLLWMVVAEVGLGVVGALWRVYAAWSLGLRGGGFHILHAGGLVVEVQTDFTVSVALTEAWQGFSWPWSRSTLGNRLWYSLGLDLYDFATIQLLVTVLMGAALLLCLPMTFARCRVRRVHLMRGVGHAAPMAAVGLLAWEVARIVLLAVSGLEAWDGVLGPPNRLVLLSAAVWCVMGFWWWRFTRDYLRLPRGMGRGVAVPGCAACVCGALQAVSGGCRVGDRPCGLRAGHAHL